MITEPTVLILGAGASKPYRFPLGAELRNEICKMIDNDDINVRILNKLLGIDSSETQAFAKHFLYSNIASIDAFLAKRTEFIDIGKLCIASILYRREIPDNIVARAKSTNIGENPIEDDWYHYLWNILIDETESIDDFVRNEIKYVTFNYDRSLEYFLYRSIMNTYGVGEEDAIKIVQQLPILHIYGSLGKFDRHTDGEAREYSTSMDHGKILQIAANGINVMPQSRDDDTVFKNARIWCHHARRIGFLGFGFDHLNIKRLNLSHAIGGVGNKFRRYIVASTINKTSAEIGRYQKMISDDLNWRTYPKNCTMTLRESGLLIN